MFDIRAIRENPEAFRAAWNRKKPGLGDAVDDIHAHDAALRTAVTDKQEAEKVRNETSKLIGKAKASGDEAEFERLRKLVADAKDRLHALLDDELLFDALKDQDDVVVRGGADVHDGWVVHELALSSARGVRWMSQQHVVAVPLEEHLPEGIELRTTRFRFVSGEGPCSARRVS